jgi:hypothetical protein
VNAGTRRPEGDAGFRVAEDESGVRGDGGLRHFFLLGLSGKGCAHAPGRGGATALQPILRVL